MKPCWVSSIAVCFPIPDDAPVINTTFFIFLY
jgi:hypothetical protein